MSEFSIINTIKLFLLAIILIFASCEDIITADLDKAPSQLVVDAQINDLSTSQTINLSLSAPYFQDGLTPKAQGAEVSIQDNEGHLVVFQETLPGVYQTNNLLGKPSNTYTLTIKYQGETYWSTATMPRKPVVDSIQYDSEINPRKNTEKRYTFYLYAQEPKGKGDNYKSKAFINNQIQLDNSQDMLRAVTLKDDLLVDGNYIKNNPCFRTTKLNSNDAVTIQFMAVDRDVFSFYFQVASQSQGGLFSPPPANINGNIYNSNVLGKKPLGLFIATPINVFEGTIIADKGTLKKK